MVANRVYSAKAQRLIDLKMARLELDRLNSFQRTAQREQELLELKQATGLNSQELIERLHQAGFNARNVDALQWLPVAMVAWASEGVTPEEVKAAKLMHLHTPANCNAEAVELFQYWFNQRPSHELWTLWEEFVQACSATQSPELHMQTGQLILEIANRVARASGGFMGFGEVSTAEREVLDKIRSLYALRAAQ